MKYLSDPATIRSKLSQVNWWVFAAIASLGCFGLVILYSAAGGSIEPWALRQGARFTMLLLVMLFLAMVDLKTWLRIAYPMYITVVVLLVVVEAKGVVNGGSQRWVDLGLIRLQPSEFMKLAIVLAMARYYQDLPRVSVTSWHALWPPMLMIAFPMALVILQPDLGTALMIALGGATMMFLAGVSWKLFAGAIAAVGAILPVAWMAMHQYQRNRVLIFLDPEKDPLGTGYHITQSKIAIGSGGFLGKGFLEGSQSHLKFLPEMQTDFIFAMMSEEFGMLGGVFILTMYGIIFAWGIWVGLSSRSHFGRMMAMGLTMTIFFYLAINMSMVMGLAPVVGIPLPLISFGGSAMMTVLLALGLIFSASLNREDPLYHANARD
jgi:rod shape determining protein RodA